MCPPPHMQTKRFHHALNFALGECHSGFISGGAFAHSYINAPPLDICFFFQGTNDINLTETCICPAPLLQS